MTLEILFNAFQVFFLGFSLNDMNDIISYICLLFKINFLMNFNMICISNHNIMLLATSLLRIYPNYVLYGKYEIGDCLYVIVLALFYHSSYPSLYVNFVYMLIIC